MTLFAKFYESCNIIMCTQLSNILFYSESHHRHKNPLIKKPSSQKLIDPNPTSTIITSPVAQAQLSDHSGTTYYPHQKEEIPNSTSAKEEVTAITIVVDDIKQNS